MLEVGNKIQSQVKTELQKNQREYYLREQMKAIQKELGEGDDQQREYNELREKIDRRVAAAEAKLQLGAASVDNQMADIEREAMDIQLQDKLLEYKQQMGLLGSGSDTSSKQIGAGTAAGSDDPIIVNETNDSNRSN